MASATPAASSAAASSTLRPWNPKNGPEPTAPQNLSGAEASAIKRLIDAEYLLYSHTERTCPFPELVKKANEAHSRIDYWALRPNKLSGARGLYVSKLVKEIETLKEDLIMNIGDDVIAGTIFALNIDDAEEEKKYFKLDKNANINTTGAAASSPTTSKNANDDDDNNTSTATTKTNNTNTSSCVDKKIFQNHPSPYEDPGSASAPKNLATSSFDILAKGKCYTFPISKDRADDLSYNGEFSEVGIEGEGDVLDNTKRESWEYPVSDLQLPPWLHHPRRFYPRLEQQIRERLCPSAGEIAIVPYKLVCYNENDFFAQHRDANNDPRHFGTLAIHLPCEEDYADTRPFENPEIYDWGEEYEQKQRSKRYGNNRNNTNNDNEEEDDPEVPHRPRGGALRLYLGRGVDRHSRNIGDEKFNDSAVQNLFSWGDYGRPSDSISQLVATILMQNYTQEELEGRHPFVSASANRLAERLHRPDGTDMTEDEAIAEAQGNDRKMPPIMFTHGNDTRNKLLSKYEQDFSRKTHPPKKNFYKLSRDHTPLKFAAWLTDVHHEVKPLLGENSHRFVMTYKLLKSANVSPLGLQIPREVALTEQVERIGKLFQQHLAENPKNSRSYPRTLGFILRHCYPVSSLSNPQACLKNVDAVVHHIFSSRFETVVAPVFLVKDNDNTVPFFDDTQSKRNVFLTSQIPEYPLIELDREANHEQMEKWFPLIGGVEWKELGFGEAFSKGSCLGNADVGCRWVYRQTAMVCLLDRPSTWMRRRVAFLIMEKGYHGNMFQRISELYPVFRNVVYYL